VGNDASFRSLSHRQGRIRNGVRGGSKPDITFVEEAKNPICFAGDIATVWDEGVEADDPATRLTIQSVTLTKLPEADDDLLEFHFDPDAPSRRSVPGKD
jgi:hypothetical protein